MQSSPARFPLSLSLLVTIDNVSISLSVVVKMRCVFPLFLDVLDFPSAHGIELVPVFMYCSESVSGYVHYCPIPLSGSSTPTRWGRRNRARAHACYAESVTHGGGSYLYSFTD